MASKYFKNQNWPLTFKEMVLGVKKSLQKGIATQDQRVIF